MYEWATGRKDHSDINREQELSLLRRTVKTRTESVDKSQERLSRATEALDWLVDLLEAQSNFTDEPTVP